MTPPLRRGRRLLQQRLAGLAFLAVLVALVGFAVAVYEKAFTPVVTVFVEADRIGNQLTKGGDVKARGVVVGEIRAVSSDGDRARIELALDPGGVGTLPSDVTAWLLPKTLFGEKYVSLVPDDASTARPLREGDVIGQDRSRTARETSQALDNLLPLLKTLRPQDVSVTLNALSTALRGRGDRLGDNLVLVEDYLRQLNPSIPTLSEDVRGLADLADTVNEAAPDFLQVLDDLSFVNRSLVDQQDELATFLTTTTGSAGELDSFLRDNEQHLIRLAADSLPSLQLFERYSPEYACLAKGLAEQNLLAAKAFGGLQPGLHITLEFIDSQGGYRPGDEPVYGEDGPPTCRGLPPNEPIRPYPADMEVTDGYCDEEEKAPGVQNGCQGREADPSRSSNANPSSDPARALAQRDVDRATVGAVAGPVLGVAPDDVPDLAVLLFGPMARGTEVALAQRR